MSSQTTINRRRLSRSARAPVKEPTGMSRVSDKEQKRDCQPFTRRLGDMEDQRDKAE